MYMKDDKKIDSKLLIDNILKKRKSKTFLINVTNFKNQKTYFQ